MANVWTVNQTLEPVTFQDQFEKPLPIEQSTRLIVLSTSKGNGKQVHTIIESLPEGFLEKEGILCLTDLSSAPSLITSLFMTPKFKKYTYRLGMIQEDALADTLPKKKNYITLITLDQMKVTAIDYVEKLEKKHLT